MPLKIDILSLFPAYFDSPFEVSILKKAQEKGIVEINCIDIRAFSEDKHKRVDDRPYGGGPGMIMTPGPCIRAIRSVQREDSHVIYLSPQGKTLHAEKCAELSSFSHLILLCGHYGGVDQRVIDMVNEEISIGDFILSNGCLPAIVVLDSVVRLIPGVLGNEESPAQDSFQSGGLQGPQYTRPQVFEGNSVPQVLLEGNHQEIKKWQKCQSIHKTRQVRPELIGGSS